MVARDEILKECPKGGVKSEHEMLRKKASFYERSIIMNFKQIDTRGWSFYIDIDRQKELLTDKCGKWMYFFDNSEQGIAFAKSICEKAVKTGAAIESKHTDEQRVKMTGQGGVCCFYCNGDDIEAHKKILSFFLENNMIRKTKTGKLYNISFKYDSQTHNSEYGKEFSSEIKLEDFVNLETGEFLEKEYELKHRKRAKGTEENIMSTPALPNKDSVQILTQSVLPHSLHGINPRGIMGASKWNKVKKEVQNKSGKKCMCCGRDIKHVPGDWIEIHEAYHFNQEKREAELLDFVGLCHECHSYIHRGFLNIQLLQGNITKEQYMRIIQHGESLLQSFGLTKNELPAEEITNPNWYLLYNGQKYNNTTFAAKSEENAR